MAEVIKHAFIYDRAFLEEPLNIRSLHDITSDQLNDMIFKGISIKASVVQQDEKKRG